MRILGVVLLVLGVLGFALGGITITRDRTVAEVGPLTLEAEDRDTIPIKPVVAGLLVVAGLGLVAFGGRRM